MKECGWNVYNDNMYMISHRSKRKPLKKTSHDVEINWAQNSVLWLLNRGGN